MGKEMRIWIKENAAINYLHHTSTAQRNLEWAEKLMKIAGTWVVVETKHLFRDQFNTAPIEGVSEDGMRIMEYCVGEIENDARKSLVKCKYCGFQEKYTHWYYKEGKDGAFCPSCHRNGYAEPLHGSSRNALEYKYHGLKLRGETSRGDGESGCTTIVFSNKGAIQNMPDEDICGICGLSVYYGGPGRFFTHEPFVNRKENVVVVTQNWGLDI